MATSSPFDKLDGPADLVIEIISPESRLLDPDEKRADFYILSSDGRYRSEVLAGFELDTTWLWRSPLPPVLEALKALKLF